MTGLLAITGHVVRYPNGAPEGRSGRETQNPASERHLWVCHRALFGGGFDGIRITVPAAPGIQELNPIDVDEIPVVLGTRLFVVPRLRALPTLHVYARSFAEVFADYL